MLILSEDLEIKRSDFCKMAKPFSLLLSHETSRCEGRKEARFSLCSKSGLMIMTGRDTIAHTLGLQNLSFVDNPDLNIELRLASSVSLQCSFQHKLPHVGLITSLFSCLLSILVKYLESSKHVFFDASY